jgi:hypothetical protein
MVIVQLHTRHEQKMKRLNTAAGIGEGEVSDKVTCDEGWLSSGLDVNLRLLKAAFCQKRGIFQPATFGQCVAESNLEFGKLEQGH